LFGFVSGLWNVICSFKFRESLMLPCLFCSICAWSGLAVCPPPPVSLYLSWHHIYIGYFTN
jgi:hypothetical protein